MRPKTTRAKAKASASCLAKVTRTQITNLSYSVDDTSEDSPLDRSVGRKQTVVKAEVERDERRIADAVACAAIPVLICALPPAIIKRWAGGDAGSAARRAKASLDCT